MVWQNSPPKRTPPISRLSRTATLLKRLFINFDPPKAKTWQQQVLTVQEKEIFAVWV